MNVGQLYAFIIEDCIKNLVNDFENAGVSTKVLTQLQHLWEQKLSETGVLQAENLKRTAPVQTNHSNFYFSHFNQMPPIQNKNVMMNTPPSDYYQLKPNNDDTNHYIQNMGQRIEPSRNINQLSSNDIDKLSYTIENPIQPMYPNKLNSQSQSPTVPVKQEPIQQVSANKLPQEDILSEKDNSVNSSDEESLGSDDEEDEELTTNHYLMCLFESVKKTKKKRKVLFKDGILHVHGREYAFKECQAEFLTR